MNASDLIAGWSLGLCVLFVCAAVLCAWTAADMRGDVEARRTAFVACVAGFLISLALWQGDAGYRWTTGQWQIASISSTSFVWRGMATLFLFGMIGTTSFPRCGHRGWLASAGLFASTSVAGMIHSIFT